MVSNAAQWFPVVTCIVAFIADSRNPVYSSPLDRCPVPPPGGGTQVAALPISSAGNALTHKSRGQPSPHPASAWPVFWVFYCNPRSSPLRLHTAPRFSWVFSETSEVNSESKVPVLILFASRGEDHAATHCGESPAQTLGENETSCHFSEFSWDTLPPPPRHSQGLCQKAPRGLQSSVLAGVCLCILKGDIFCKNPLNTSLVLPDALTINHLEWHVLLKRFESRAGFLSWELVQHSVILCRVNKNSMKVSGSSGFTSFLLEWILYLRD